MIEAVAPGYQLLVDNDNENSRERLFEIIARAGALRADRAAALTGQDDEWQFLVREGYILERYPKYGSTSVRVLTLSNKGREAFEKVEEERADYVAGPQSVANRAHQVETLHHLAPEFEVTEVIWKAASGLPRGDEVRERTDQILYFRVRPKGSTATGDRAPILYTLGASSPIPRKKIQQLMFIHHQDVVHWGHPMIIAVPEMTPLLELVMTRLRRQVEMGKLSSVDLPRLVVVPPPCVPKKQSPLSLHGGSLCNG